jgi:hypothetical protein
MPTLRTVVGWVGRPTDGRVIIGAATAPRTVPITNLEGEHADVTVENGVIWAATTAPLAGRRLEMGVAPARTVWTGDRLYLHDVTVKSLFAADPGTPQVWPSPHPRVLLAWEARMTRVAGETIVWPVWARWTTASGAVVQGEAGRRRWVRAAALTAAREAWDGRSRFVSCVGGRVRHTDERTCP